MKKVTEIIKRICLIGLLFIVLSLSFTPIETHAQSNLIPTSEQICGGPCPLIDADFEADSDGLFRFIIFIARFLTFIGVGLAVLFFVLAGIQYIIGRNEDGKQNLITTFTGLIVIIVAYTVVSVIANILSSGDLGDIFQG